jgi:hypothetical protein
VYVKTGAEKMRAKERAKEYNEKDRERVKRERGRFGGSENKERERESE